MNLHGKKAGVFAAGVLAGAGMLACPLGADPLKTGSLRANAYVLDYTIPAAGGCPQPNRLNPGNGGINRRWSTSLATPQTIFTVAPPGTADQLNEIEQTIEQSFSVWAGVTGTTINAANYPAAFQPLQRISTADACANDQGTNPSGLNSICFNQTSSAFSTGVLAFTRVFTADAVGQSIGASGPAAFPGQILEADVYIRNDGQATYATPAALAANANSYDLESVLIHELGHFFGMDESAVWHAAMFPIAPSPGTFFGSRPSAQAPDAPLGDDDRTGARVLYPDPFDAVNVGTVLGRVMPANSLSLALLTATSANRPVTGIFGAHVVAVDADSGAVIAGALGGWSCDPNNPPASFDGSYMIQRLPVGRNYIIYAEPLDGEVTPANVYYSTSSVCNLGATPCIPPPVNTNFVPRIRAAP